MIDRAPHDHNPSPYDDDWEDQPSQGWFYKWVLGVALPLIMIVAGGYGLWTGQVLIYGQHGVAMKLTGLNAALACGASISLALFLHCHYYWGNLYDQMWPAVLGKIIGLMGFIAATVVILVRVGVLNRH